MRLQICDPTRANEALWVRYQNWHFKFNILFNIKGTFWHQNDFHIIFLTKVTDNLISNCLITLKINYQDIGRQSYWFVQNLLKMFRTIGLKRNFLSLRLRQIGCPIARGNQFLVRATMIFIILAQLCKYKSEVSLHQSYHSSQKHQKSYLN